MRIKCLTIIEIETGNNKKYENKSMCQKVAYSGCIMELLIGNIQKIIPKRNRDF